MAYNQADYVVDAIHAAFAQTYSPLEIVLSDDCSPDTTGQIMEDMAAAYTGPHKVIVNRNPQNLGIAAHINRILELSSGQVIVQNAGDDISFPTRVSEIMDAWEGTGHRAMTIYSNAYRVDQDRQKIGLRGTNDLTAQDPSPKDVVEHGLIALGATCAWSREIFDTFGPFPDELFVEDLVSTFRSSVLGKIVYINRPLLEWRTGGLSYYDPKSTGYDHLYGMGLTYSKWRAASYRGIMRDIRQHDILESEAIVSICEEKIALLDLTLYLASASHLCRIAQVPRAISLSIRQRTPDAIKLVMKYSLDWVYIWKQGRQAQKNTYPAPSE